MPYINPYRRVGAARGYSNGPAPARALKQERQSADVVLAPTAGLRPLGFVEARGE